MVLVIVMDIIALEGRGCQGGIKDLFWILFINGFSSATITIDYIKIEKDIW